jgi:hypothetical protein
MVFVGRTWCEKDLADSAVDSRRHGCAHCNCVHDEIVVRELHALHFPGCPRREADCAGDILGVSPLEVMRWKCFGFCLAEYVIWELCGISMSLNTR